MHSYGWRYPGWIETQCDHELHVNPRGNKADASESDATQKTVQHATFSGALVPLETGGAQYYTQHERTSTSR